FGQSCEHAGTIARAIWLPSCRKLLAELLWLRREMVQGSARELVRAYAQWQLGTLGRQELRRQRTERGGFSRSLGFRQPHVTVQRRSQLFGRRCGSARTITRAIRFPSRGKLLGKLRGLQ